MCTKITFNRSHIFNSADLSPVNTTPERKMCHRPLDRSHSDPAIRLTDREDQEDSPGLEPNCDLFGIQLEVFPKFFQKFSLDINSLK